MKRAALVAFALLVVAGPGLSAQQTTVLPDSAAPADSARIITPGKAFLRSLVIPGWGQASVGAYVRGGTFFALQSASSYMLLKTMNKVGDARRLERRQIALARDSLQQLMRDDSVANVRLSEPFAFKAAVDSTPGVRNSRRLIDTRKEQRQDWVTYALVFTLASGVDAFVAAHLANFPASIDATPRTDGGLDLSVRVPLGRPHQ